LGLLAYEKVLNKLYGRDNRPHSPHKQIAVHVIRRKWICDEPEPINDRAKNRGGSSVGHL